MKEYGIKGEFKPFCVCVGEEAVLSKEIKVQQRRTFCNIVDVQEKKKRSKNTTLRYPVFNEVARNIVNLYTLFL